MSQQPIEVILTRQLGTRLSMPAFLVDAEGQVVDFNGPAEQVLGDRLSQARNASARELVALFDTQDEDGEPIPPERMPLLIALEERHPAHARMRVRDEQGSTRQVAITAVPLVGHGSRFLGAIAFFWEEGV